MTAPPRICVYTRVSGETQAGEDKDGLRRQREACEKAAREMGYQVDEWFEDAGVSGTLGWQDRPAFRAMRHKLRPGDIVIVENLDRIARDMMQGLIVYDDFKSNGFRLFTTRREELFNDPTASLVRDIITRVAAYQREVLVQRTASAKVAKRAQGIRVDGPAPYGQNEDPERRAEEQRALALMREMAANGATLASIASALHAAGIRPPRSEKWGHSTILKFVRDVKRPYRVA